MNISVIITTYNRYIPAKRAIISVLKQSRLPDEIIVVEDGSDSGIRNWIRQHYPGSIKYIQHETNKGLSAARNTGIKHAKGEYIAFLDDDDLWLQNKLQKQVDTITKENKDHLLSMAAVYCGSKRVHSKKRVEKITLPIHDGNLKESIITLKRISTVSSSCLFKSEVLRKVNGFDELLPSSIDHDMWMKLAEHEYSVCNVTEPLVLVPYKADEKSMMSSMEPRLLGVKMFTEKWEPTFKKWFGNKSGMEFTRKYYATVISRLAASQIYENNYSNYITCVISIFRYSHYYLFNSYTLLRTGIPVLFKK